MAGGVDVRVDGVEEFVSLGQAIRRHADRKALQKELYSGLQRATKGTRESMKAAIPTSVPQRGGLAARTVRGARFATRSTGGGANAGVRIVASSKTGQLVNLNAGRLRHPVYGGRTWVTQTKGITPGFLDREFEQSSPAVRRELGRVIDEVSRKVTAST